MANEDDSKMKWIAVIVVAICCTIVATIVIISKGTFKFGKDGVAILSESRNKPTVEITNPPIDHGDSNLDVPIQIDDVHIIMQNPGSLVNGSSTRYARTTRDELIRRFPEFVVYARSNGKRLIITASNSAGTLWYHKDIRYNGEFLKEVLYRSLEGNENFWGVEVPLSKVE